MARSSKFVNPGKSTLLTVLSLVLIIGIPGLVAYVDSSDDTYYSNMSLSDIKSVTVRDANYYTFDVTDVVDGDTHSVVVADTATDESTLLSSMTSTTYYQLVLGADGYHPCTSKITFSTTDEAVTSVTFVLWDSVMSAIQGFTMTYNDDSGLWEYTMSSVEAASVENAVYAGFRCNYASATTMPTDFDCTYSVAEKTSIFTDDVVEMIVLVGGILLLVCGTFSLSFIDLDTPGKAFRAAGRGIRNASRRH